ncbi:hypothetical protein QCD75_05000 [Arthrobacter sp. PsM3]|nr:hypothetical protein [Arthrobacter sp. PsM3]
MIEDRERAIAYITGRICTHSNARLIRDVETGQLIMMSGEVTEDRVHVYDLQTRGYVAGSRTAGRWNLFHTSDNATIVLIQTEPGRFAGLDQSSGQWFTVMVTGRISLVRDFVPGRSRRYSL